MDKKVLHIVDSLSLGGAQTVLKGIFEDQENNKNIFLFSLRNKDTKIEIDHENTIRFASRKKYSLVPLLELRRLIKREEIEIIHTHLFRSHVFGWILKKFFFPKIKWILHEHGQIFQGSSYYEQFLKISKNKTNLFIAVSASTKNEIVSKIGIENVSIKVLYNFINFQGITKKTRQKGAELRSNYFKEDDFILGLVGRLERIKGYDLAIDALQDLDEEVKLLIVGDGSERDKLKSQVRKGGLNNRVVFVGYKENVLEYMLAMNILLVPSRFESFGISAVEGQMTGVPVIVSNAGGLPEVVSNKENGMVFERDDIRDLVKNITEVKRNIGLRDSLILNGIKNAKRFSREAYMQELSALYEKLIIPNKKSK